MVVFGQLMSGFRLGRFIIHNFRKRLARVFLASIGFKPFLGTLHLSYIKSAKIAEFDGR